MLLTILSSLIGYREAFDKDGGAGGDGSQALFQLNPSVVFSKSSDKINIAFLAVDIVLVLVSLFFYFRRNGTVFDARAFLASLLCASCYIAYALGVPLPKPAA